MTRLPAVCLLGPTATGKTELAISLCKRFPFEIISVDSALVYRGMDIGTAKPDQETLKRTPHRLVDIRENVPTTRPSTSSVGCTPSAATSQIRPSSATRDPDGTKWRVASSPVSTTRTRSASVGTCQQGDSVSVALARDGSLGWCCLHRGCPGGVTGAHVQESNVHCFIQILP